MLIPELDKLRNKELIFGLMYDDGGGIRTILGMDVDGYYNTMDEYFRYGQLGYMDGNSRIGHALNRGWICYVFSGKLGDNNKVMDIMDSITDILEGDPILFSQNELQRMQNKETRERLKPLLIEFSKYL